MARHPVLRQTRPTSQPLTPEEGVVSKWRFKGINPCNVFKTSELKLF